MTRTEMTRIELAEKLNHLDPGACLPLGLTELERIFGEGERHQMTKVLETFAEEHRCTVSYRGRDHAVAEFTKDDVF